MQGAEMQPAEAPRPLGELFAELARETAELVREEARLVKVEMTGKAKGVAKDAAMVGVGGGLAMVGSLVLMAALVLILGLVMPYWAAALLVGVVVTGTGAAVAMAGVRALRRVDPVPRETLQTLKEDGQWLSEQVSR